MAKIKFEWETVDTDTFRAKVLGGWVMRFDNEIGHNTWSSSTLFIPDINHDWEIDYGGD